MIPEMVRQETPDTLAELSQRGKIFKACSVIRCMRNAPCASLRFRPRVLPRVAAPPAFTGPGKLETVLSVSTIATSGRREHDGSDFLLELSAAEFAAED